MHIRYSATRPHDCIMCLVQKTQSMSTHDCQFVTWNIRSVAVWASYVVTAVNTLSVVWKRGREGETETETDRQTDRQTDWQIERQTDREADRQTSRHEGRQTETERHRHRQTGRQRQTDKRTGGKTEMEGQRQKQTDIDKQTDRISPSHCFSHPWWDQKIGRDKPQQ